VLGAATPFVERETVVGTANDAEELTGESPEGSGTVRTVLAPWGATALGLAVKTRPVWVKLTTLLFRFCVSTPVTEILIVDPTTTVFG